MTACFFCERIDSIKKGTDPYFVAELPESYVVLSDEQLYRGYCILITKDHAEHFHRIEAAKQARLAAEIAKVGAAIEKVCATPRLNYACLGNEVAHVHWHVIPRYADDELRTKPTWLRPIEERRIALAPTELALLRADLAKGILA